MSYELAIIGGGAAGLAAAVSAVKADPSASVLLLEKNDRVGRKLLGTGNGRCNLSNTQMGASFYHSQSPDFVGEILSAVNTAAVVRFFDGLGLYVTEEDTRLYPYSQRASSVLDVLRLALRGITIKTSANVSNINKKDNRFLIQNGSETLISNKLIITTGGLAAPVTGSTGDGLGFLSSFGHTVRLPYPALTPLKARHPSLLSLKGIRVKPCRLTMDGISAYGEVLFTEYGLSGIPAMQVSMYITECGQKTVYLDLLPDWTEHEVFNYINGRKTRFPYFPPEDFFTGLFHKCIGQALLREADKTQFTKIIKKWPFVITGTKGYMHAQVMGGGACLTEFYPKNMESRILPGLYAAGEVLDAAGECGGYNLHWAWATGILAGQGAVKPCGLG
jgi:hypothetical protein